MARISTFDDLLQRSNLKDFRIHEDRARRVVRERPEEDAGTTDQKIAVGARILDDRILSFRFRLVLAADRSEFVTDIEALYTVDTEGLDVEQGDLVDESTIVEFGQRIGLMNVWPLMRAAIHAGASRLRLDTPILPLITPGEFKEIGDLDPEQIENTFGDNRSELDAAPTSNGAE